MGGTSFDVSLVVDGEAEIESQLEIAGHPVLTPSVAVTSLGAGGGSIAYVESGGLRVGPESAGASPGPACYGRGGTRPTVTDANLLLGRIPETALLGGTIALDRDAATAARRTGRGRARPRHARARRGHRRRRERADGRRDPRGHGRPRHRPARLRPARLRRRRPAARGRARRGARDRARRRARRAGNALGLGDAAGADPPRLRARVLPRPRGARRRPSCAPSPRELREAGEAALRDDGVDAARVRCDASADLRYRGQEYTLNVPAPRRRRHGRARAPFHRGAPRALRPLEPERAHRGREPPRGRARRREPLPVEPARRGRRARARHDGRGRLRRRARSRPRSTRAPRSAPAATSTGPCIVLEDGCTTLVPPGWHGTTTAGRPPAAGARRVSLDPGQRRGDPQRVQLDRAADEQQPGPLGLHADHLRDEGLLRGHLRRGGAPARPVARAADVPRQPRDRDRRHDRGARRARTATGPATSS